MLMVLLDLQNEMLNFIDKQVRRLCLTKNSFIALKQGPKSGRDFYTLNPSRCEWISYSIPLLSIFDIKYPDMLLYFSLLLIVSGSSLQMFVFDLQLWFKFKLVITDNKIEIFLTGYNLCHHE